MHRTHGSQRKLRAEQLENRQLLHGGGFAGGVEPPTIEERVASVFERYDESGDSQLTVDEVSERAWDRLSAADIDESGGVSQEELATHIETAETDRPRFVGRGMNRGRGFGGDRGGHCHVGPGNDMPVEERVDALFASQDASEDGLLTADEVSERTWQRISEVDTNEDGVSQEELLTHIDAKRAERIAELFERLDGNEDGGVTADEVSQRLWSRLSEADTDGDGSVSQEELESYIEAMHSGTEDGDADETDVDNSPTDESGATAASTSSASSVSSAVSFARTAARMRRR